MSICMSGGIHKHTISWLRGIASPVSRSKASVSLLFPFAVVPASLLILALLFSGNTRADELGNAVRTAVGKADPSIVRLRVIGGEQSIDGEKVNSLVTTGVVISDDGEILTSQFALQGNPEAILAEDKTGNRANLRIIATDRVRRMVLLKAEKKGDWTPASSTAGESIQIGQWSIALGRFYQAEASNVSVGILSATGRIHGMAIQTDAKVSPVNYGGPLIDLDGRVLGILVPLSPRGQGNASSGIEWYDSGIGFAIPMQDALKIADRLRNGKDLKPGRLGVKLASAGMFSSDIRVAGVVPKGPASIAGLQRNDQLVSVDGRTIERVSILEEAVASRYSGDSLTLQVKRGSESLSLKVDLMDELPVQVPPYLGFTTAKSKKSKESKVVPGADAIAKILDGAIPGRSNTKPVPAAEKDQTSAEKSDHVALVVVNDSPASHANLPARIELLKLNDQQTTSLSELKTALSDVTADSKVKVEYRVPGSTDVKVDEFAAEARPEVVTPLAEEVLAAIELTAGASSKLVEDDETNNDPPAAAIPSNGAADANADLQRKEMPLEERGKAVIFSSTVPSKTSPGIVILVSTHDVAEEQILNRWRPFLASHNLVVAVPVNPEKSELSADDIPLVMTAIQGIASEFKADLRRVVVVGDADQSKLCWQLAFGGPSPVSGIALTSGWISSAESESIDGSGYSVLLLTSPGDAQGKALFTESRSALLKTGFWVARPTEDDTERSVADWTVLLRAF